MRSDLFARKLLEIIEKSKKDNKNLIEQIKEDCEKEVYYNSDEYLQYREDHDYAKGM